MTKGEATSIDSSYYRIFEHEDSSYNMIILQWNAHFEWNEMCFFTQQKKLQNQLMFNNNNTKTVSVLYRIGEKKGIRRHCKCIRDCLIA